jgi:insecticidal toxin complex protein TccC
MPSDDFVAVEIGVGSKEQMRERGDSSPVASDEAYDTLKSYSEQYDILAKSDIFKETKNTKQTIRNFELGHNIANERHRLFKTMESERALDMLVGRKPDIRIFALIKKSDANKTPAERNIFGITQITARVPEEKEDAELTIDFTIIAPDAQLSGISLRRAVDAGKVAENTQSLRGAGTYLTMNALKQVSETVNMKKIRVQTQSPIAAAMARKWAEHKPF